MNTIFNKLLVASLTDTTRDKMRWCEWSHILSTLFWRKHTRLHVLLNIDLKGHSHEIEVPRTEAHLRARNLDFDFNASGLSAWMKLGRYPKWYSENLQFGFTCWSTEHLCSLDWYWTMWRHVTEYKYPIGENDHAQNIARANSLKITDCEKFDPQSLGSVSSTLCIQMRNQTGFVIFKQKILI